jgi:DNA-binding transcriptional LysR family regulator
MQSIMNDIQISDADLRLLRVLDSLLTTRRITRAAAILGVSPSAISHSLRLLRENLGDPILVRSQGELQPTALADALQSTLRAGLLQLSGVLSQKLIFDPATSTRKMSLATPDHPLFIAEDDAASGCLPAVDRSNCSGRSREWLA